MNKINALRLFYISKLCKKVRVIVFEIILMFKFKVMNNNYITYGKKKNNIFTENVIDFLIEYYMSLEEFYMNFNFLTSMQNKTCKTIFNLSA